MTSLKRLSKKDLQIVLSKIERIRRPKIELEQYETPPDIAADTLWIAYMKGYITGNICADFCAGSGIFAVGMALLGARKVIAVEIDKNAAELIKRNAERFEVSDIIEVVCEDILNFDNKVYFSITNPPFGIQSKIDFLSIVRKVVSLSDVAFILIPSPRLSILERMFNVTPIREYNFPLRHIAWFHEKRVEYTRVLLVEVKRES